MWWKLHENLIFIWPSWIWKSKWTKRIARYTSVECVEMDERIWNNPLMKQFLEWIEWKDDAEKMWKAFWKPWENPQQYRIKEWEYLRVEREEMQRLAWEIIQNSWQPLICDLTWSAIYCRDELRITCTLWKVVYLKAWNSHYEEMKRKFLEDPKPVCWWWILDDWGIALNNWNAKEQLSELYQRLLDTRDKLYSEVAHVILPWKIHRDIVGTINDSKILLDAINSWRFDK